MSSSEAIRPGTLQDATRIAEMSRRYIEHGLGWSWTPARVARAIQSDCNNVIVASDGPAVIGFAIMRYGDEEARLNLFAVDPRYRRRGIGTRLIQWLEETALVNGNGVVYLEARAGNASAIGFYQSLGYRVVQRVPGYYSGTETAVRMAHDLWVTQPH